jgi:hypothetical protein
MRPVLGRLRVFTSGWRTQMADSSFSFHDAKQQLENEMTDRQVRLMSILTGQPEGLAGEKELLESEIEDRNFAFDKLEGQNCCDCCGTQVDVPETLRVRITKYSAMMLRVHLVMEKVRVRAEWALPKNCFLPKNSAFCPKTLFLAQKPRPPLSQFHRIAST